MVFGVVFSAFIPWGFGGAFPSSPRGPACSRPASPRPGGRRRPTAAVRTVDVRRRRPGSTAGRGADGGGRRGGRGPQLLLQGGASRGGLRGENLLGAALLREQVQRQAHHHPAGAGRAGDGRGAPARSYWARAGRGGWSAALLFPCTPSSIAVRCSPPLWQLRACPFRPAARGILLRKPVLGFWWWTSCLPSSDDWSAHCCSLNGGCPLPSLLEAHFLVLSMPQT